MKISLCSLCLCVSRFYRKEHLLAASTGQETRPTENHHASATARIFSNPTRATSYGSLAHRSSRKSSSDSQR